MNTRSEQIASTNSHDLFRGKEKSRYRKDTILPVTETAKDYFDNKKRAAKELAGGERDQNWTYYNRLSNDATRLLDEDMTSWTEGQYADTLADTLDTMISLDPRHEDLSVLDPSVHAEQTFIAADRIFRAGCEKLYPSVEEPSPQVISGHIYKTLRTLEKPNFLISGSGIAIKESITASIRYVLGKTTEEIAENQHQNPDQFLHILEQIFRENGQRVGQLGWTIEEQRRLGRLETKDAVAIHRDMDRLTEVLYGILRMIDTAKQDQINRIGNTIQTAEIQQARQRIMPTLEGRNGEKDYKYWIEQLIQKEDVWISEKSNGVRAKAFGIFEETFQAINRQQDWKENLFELLKKIDTAQKKFLIDPEVLKSAKGDARTQKFLALKRATETVWKETCQTYRGIEKLAEKDIATEKERQQKQGKKISGSNMTITFSPSNPLPILTHFFEQAKKDGML
jgi:hypothetical protein